MPKFGADSLKQYATLCEELQLVSDSVIQFFDFKIIEGFRSKEDQNRAFLNHKSQVRWPNGKHNKTIEQGGSDAMDVAPFPVDWSSDAKAQQRFCYLAGFIVMAARDLGIILRWGGDWDGDRDTRDENFRDLGHFEVIRP